MLSFSPKFIIDLAVAGSRKPQRWKGPPPTWREVLVAVLITSALILGTVEVLLWLFPL